MATLFLLYPAALTPSEHVPIAQLGWGHPGIQDGLLSAEWSVSSSSPKQFKLPTTGFASAHPHLPATTVSHRAPPVPVQVSSSRDCGLLEAGAGDQPDSGKGVSRINASRHSTQQASGILQSLEATGTARTSQHRVKRRPCGIPQTLPPVTLKAL